MGIKRDWYQSNERVILALLSKSCTEVQVQFESHKVTVSGINKGIEKEFIALIDDGVDYVK